MWGLFCNSTQNTTPLTSIYKKIGIWLKSKKNREAEKKRMNVVWFSTI